MESTSEEYKNAKLKERKVKKVVKEENDASQYIEDIDVLNRQIDPHFYATLMKQIKEEREYE